MNVLKTTEDAVKMLCAATLMVALHAHVTTASKEMDSPAEVCCRHASYWRSYPIGTIVFYWTLKTDIPVANLPYVDKYKWNFARICCFTRDAPNIVVCCIMLYVVLTIRPDTEYLLQYSVETDAGAKQWFIFSQIGAPAVHGQTRMSLSLQ